MQMAAKKPSASKTPRKALWLSHSDDAEMERLKRRFGVTTRAAVLRELFERVPLPKKKAKKKK
jgi:hypothetical protein